MWHVNTSTGSNGSAIYWVADGPRTRGLAALMGSWDSETFDNEGAAMTICAVFNGRDYPEEFAVAGLFGEGP